MPDRFTWKVQVEKNGQVLEFTCPETKEKKKYFETELPLGEALWAARNYILKQRDEKV